MTAHNIDAATLADRKADRMSPARAPFAELDDTLRHTRHLLFLFDGTICDLFTSPTAMSACDRLRKAIIEQQTSLPPEITGTTDPLDVVVYAADYLGRDAAIRAEAELTQLEYGAAANANPVPYIDDTIRASRESGRSVNIVSQNRARAVKRYLSRHDLTQLIASVTAREVPDVAMVSYERLIERATAGLGIDPAACTFICTTADAIRETESNGVYRIGYARTMHDYDSLVSAGASAIVTSLADLTLRLRAQPLPS